MVELVTTEAEQLDPLTVVVVPLWMLLLVEADVLAVYFDDPDEMLFVAPALCLYALGRGLDCLVYPEPPPLVLEPVDELPGEC